MPKNHIKVYLKGMGIQKLERFEDMYIECETCPYNKAVDVHHIEPRGRGGSKDMDTIENLMGLCRQCHLMAEKKEFTKEYLKEIHLKNLQIK